MRGSDSRGPRGSFRFSTSPRVTLSRHPGPSADLAPWFHGVIRFSRRPFAGRGVEAFDRLRPRLARPPFTCADAPFWRPDTRAYLRPDVA